jgi:hypothetical protein
MKKSSRLLLIFSLILVVLTGVYFLLNLTTGFGDYPMKHIPQGFVRTDFRNESREEIIAIRMMEGEVSFSPSLLKRPIAPNETRTINKKHQGEGIFAFEVELASGKRLRSNEMYVEGGYYIHQTVKSDTIITEY